MTLKIFTTEEKISWGVIHAVTFLLQVGPAWQSHTSSFNSVNLAYPLNLVKPEQGLSINSTRIKPDSFSTVPRASGPVFMFCVPRLFFGITEGVGSRFHIFAPGHVFGGTEGIGSRFHVLRARTRFRRYRGRRVPFSCFARPDYFSALPRESGPVLMFWAPGFIFGGTEGVGSRFQVLCARTRFRRYRVRRVPFSCFARPDSFSPVPTSLGPVFMFCAPELVFDGTRGVRSLFHVLRSRTRFRLYRGRRVSFLCFVLPDSFSAVPGA
jgi:hypothetical protein